MVKCNGATVMIRGREITVKIGADKQKIKTCVYISKYM